MTDSKLAVCAVAGLAFLVGAGSASAQSPAPATSKIYLNANVGGQLAKRTLDTSVSQTVYDETATLRTAVPIGTGPLFDFGAGYRVYNNLFVGVTVSTFSTTSDGATRASIPNPIFFNRNVEVTGSTGDVLKHHELAILPQLVYTRALSDKVDLAVGVGPAIIRVKQDLVGSFTVPPGTQTANPLITSASATGTGVNATLDLIYNLAEKWGVGGYVRYAGAKVELAGAEKELNVGGMQAGGGIRLRF